MELSRYDEIKAMIDKFIYTVDYSDLGEGGTAYTLMNTNEFAGTHYKMVIDNKNEELFDFYFMHESGHIIFTHVNPNKIQELNNKNKFRAAYSKFKKYFDKSNYTAEDIYAYFQSYVFNMIMDWQINSDFFTKEEYDYFSNIIGGGCYPTDYDYPEKLTWNDYLNLIIMDPDKFMQKLMENQQQNGNGQGQSKQGNGQGGSGSSNSKCSEDIKNRTKDEMTAAIDKLVETMKDKFQEEIKKAAAQEELKNQEAQAGVDGTGNRGFGRGTGSNPTKLTESYETYEELERFILSNITNKIESYEKRDCMYNYNRRRHGTNILIPKIRKQIVNRDSGLTVLMDVSGSVSCDDIKNFVNVFKNISKKLSKNCHLVLWDTRLVAEYGINDEIYPASGGGTDIALGIAYVMNKPEYKKTTLFVVSDFEDNLQDWIKTDYKNAYGICWNEKSYNDNIRSFTNETEREWKQLFNKIFIKKS